MGKRHNRKQTLKVKKGNGEDAAREEIRVGLAAGSKFRNIAAAAMRHRVGPERALGLVMEEYANDIRREAKGDRQEVTG